MPLLQWRYYHQCRFVYERHLTACVRMVSNHFQIKRLRGDRHFKHFNDFVVQHAIFPSVYQVKFLSC